MIAIAVFAEDELGSWLARGVVDRVACSVDWITTEHLDSYRTWWSHRRVEQFTFVSISRLYRERFSRFSHVHPSRIGEAALDEVMLLKLFRFFADVDDRPHVVLVARDTDHFDRREGFERARSGGDWKFGIVGAYAIPEAEAWLICSWEPRSERERETLAELRRELGLDPVARSHELESRGDKKRDTKSVIAALEAHGHSTRDDFATTPLEDLEQRGAHNGLADFIRDSRTTLLPLLSNAR